MIQYVLDGLQQQVEHIAINSHHTEYAQFNLPLIADEKLHQGPLHGLHACMQDLIAKRKTEAQYKQIEWLFLTACDMPNLPSDCVDMLLEPLADESEDYLAACIQYDGFLQPTASLWHISLMEKLSAAIHQQHWSGLKIFFSSLQKKGRVVNYSQQVENPFININSALELRQFEEK